MFFFMTLYLQQVLGFSALQTGLAFLPFSAAMGIGSGLIGRMPQRVDPRIPIVAGIAAAAAGLWLMSRLGVAATMRRTCCRRSSSSPPASAPRSSRSWASRPATPRSATAASPPGLMTTAQQIGGAIGIAVMISIATGHTTDALADGALPGQALTDGFAAAFRIEAIVLLVAAVARGRGARRPSRGDPRRVREPRAIVAPAGSCTEHRRDGS